jgi:hypothetical protein
MYQARQKGEMPTNFCRKSEGKSLLVDQSDDGRIEGVERIHLA